MGKKADAKDWKAVTLDWTDLQSYDNAEQLGICLTQRQVAILKALLTPAYWSTRWTNLTATVDELDAFVANIDYKLDGNDCEVESMLFRDNPNDPCEVQFSNDGGVLWNTMFRKDNCSPGGTEDSITNIYNDIDIVTTNHTTWNNDITNVAPEWVYVDTDSDNALCWAIQQYVDVLCEQAIAQINANNQALRDANDWMDDLGAILSGYVIGWITILSNGLLTFPALIVGAFVYATTVLLEAIWDYLINLDTSMFEDQDARDIVSCYMWEQIVGSTPQWEAWRDSLSNYETFGGNVRVIAEYVNFFNQDTDVYIQWMMLTEEINQIRDVLPPCPCPSTWEHTWDIENVGIEAWVIENEVGELGPYGTYVAGVGVECEHGVIPNGHHWNSVFRLVLPEAVQNIQSIKVYYDAVKGTWESNDDFLKLWLTGLGTLAWTQGSLMTGDDQDKTFLHGSPGEATDVKVFYRVAEYDPGPQQPNGSGVITKITLGGVGVDPFSGRDTD